MKHCIPVLLTIILLLLSRVACADYIAVSGQTICYDTGGGEIPCAGTGQNGDTQAGAPWPSSRFTLNSDQSVTDQLTGLAWAQEGGTPGPAACVPGLAKTWLEAFEHVTCLNTTNYLGHRDWRLPGVRELRSLINYGAAQQSTWLNGAGFNDVKDGEYWSSTTVAASTGSGWTVHMGTGGVMGITGKTGSAYVLPVRGGLDAVAIYPDTTHFGDIASGSSSAPFEFLLFNSGATALTVSKISIIGRDAAHFNIASGGSAPCGGLSPTIQAGGSCSVLVSFVPTSIGLKEAVLSILSSSASRPNMSAPISGVAVNAGIIAPRASGQTICYNTGGGEIPCAGTGQNGDTQAGAPWPSSRFTLNSDQSVTDQLTGLAWAQEGGTPGPAACVPGLAKTWLEAFEHVTCLNTTNYLGHRDWRLPGVRELRSLINYGAAQQSTWLNGAGFNDVKDGEYWSSTTVAASTGSGWTVHLGTGGVTGLTGKTGSAYVLPVRGGLTNIYLLDVMKNGTGAGTVTAPAGTGKGISCGNQCSATYLHDNQVTLTATPDTGSIFTGWSGDCSGTGSCTVTMDGTRSVTATFTALYRLNISVNPPGAGAFSPASGQSYPSGTVVPIKVIPNKDYTFASWSGPVADSASAGTTVTMAGPTTLIANLVGLPLLNATLGTAKSGLTNARLWPVTLTNTGKGPAQGAKVDKLTLTQTYGAACLPVVKSPLPTMGDIVVGASATGYVTIDFSSCSALARFTAVITYSAANGGGGSRSYLNQFR